MHQNPINRLKFVLAEKKKTGGATKARISANSKKHVVYKKKK